MAKARQGDIWWINFPKPAGRRPALLLTRSNAIPHLTHLTVAPLTRTIRGIDSEVVLSPDDGFPSLCAIALDNITTIHRTLMDQQIIKVSPAMMEDVFAAIRFAFAMP